MGVDWVPARVRDGVDENVLEELLREQARIFTTAYVGEDLLTVRPDASLDEDEARKRMIRASERLQEVLEVFWDWNPPWRVYVITANWRFPPEWRDAAWSGLSPAAAREALTRWRHWYEGCLSGRYEHYLRRLRTWELARHVAGLQKELLGKAVASLDTDNRKTRRPEFRQLRHQVFELPAPPRIPLPGPVPADGEDLPSPEQDEHWEMLVAHMRRLKKIYHPFSRAGGYGMMWPEWVKEEEPERADPWLEEFFQWLQPLVEEGYALYLW